MAGRGCEQQAKQGSCCPFWLGQRLWGASFSQEQGLQGHVSWVWTLLRSHTLPRSRRLGKEMKWLGDRITSVDEV